MFKLVALLYLLFVGALVADALTEAPAGEYIRVVSTGHHYPGSHGP